MREEETELFGRSSRREDDEEERYGSDGVRHEPGLRRAASAASMFIETLAPMGFQPGIFPLRRPAAWVLDSLPSAHHARAAARLLI